MSFLFSLSDSIDELSAQLVKIFERFENEIAKAAALFEIEGERLETLARTLPKHQAHYAMLMQEARALIKWLENEKQRQEGVVLKNINRSPRALTSTDQRMMIAGERSVVEINQLIIEAAQMAGLLDEIVESFKQMGWMLSSIVKLRIAELSDVII